MHVIVVGGGPAGMMSAIASAEKNNEVIIIEKMNSLGRKLLITGKGRCNITSSLEMEDFIKNTPGNGMFLYSAYQKYTNKDIVDFLKKQGLEVKEERGNRIFPVTDKSLDVLKCFEKKLNRLKVKIMLNTKVTDVLVENNSVKGVRTEKETAARVVQIDCFGTVVKEEKMVLSGITSIPCTTAGRIEIKKEK